MRGMPVKKDIADLPSDVQAQIRSLDDRIDTTDAPEILDWSDARRGVFYRHSSDRPESPHMGGAED